MRVRKEAPKKYFVNQSNILRYLRVAFAVGSQEKLAELIGIDRSKITRAENCLTALDIVEWGALATYFKFDPGAFINGFLEIKKMMTKKSLISQKGIQRTLFLGDE